MKSPYCLIILAGLLTLSAVQAERHTTDVEQNVGLQLSFTNAGFNALMLHIALRNDSSRTLTTFLNDLPWQSQQSLILVLVDPKAGDEVLRQEYVLESPISGEAILKPNDVLTGNVSLTNRFPTMLRRLGENELVLFWSYQFQSKDDITPPRLGGWMTLNTDLVRKNGEADVAK